ncbi:PRD domain-containing protein [Companilactobacillus farciminis]|uniref:PRD domain-containing protein n=1 Tax=Companilactobacillus farciminis TaxID=1612 RepID=UPI00191587EF|nr:PRD domain-containing protein [Companilactobacillus farciminis]
MKVKKILNNNVALIDKGGHDSVIYSPGISFKKSVGQHITENEIKKTYVLDSKDRLEHFSYLLAHSSAETVSLVNDLVEYGESFLDKKANDYLYLALLDHISFAQKRGLKGEFIRSPLTWEVRKFYPEFYKIGSYAVKKMRTCYSIDFPDDEAVSIALHFVNIEEDKSHLSENIDDMEVLKNILNIIQFQYAMTFNESSMNYMRLVTHLQYFIERLRRDNLYGDDDAALYETVTKLYPKAYKTTEKIENYVDKKFHKKLSKDEYTYLMIHINRVTERKDKK